MDEMGWGILIVVLCLLAAGAFFLVRRRRQTPQEPEAVYRYACPQCKQRIRYRKEQIGRKAMCKNCFHAFVYPAEPAAPGPAGTPRAQPNT